jgi:Fur family ferric uptake transcriptional regulator
MKMNFKIKKNYDIKRLNDYIATHGLKSSKKRQFIIGYFLKQDSHISAEELYNQIKNKIPGIGYSTVYRTLKLLAECGLAIPQYFEKRLVRFEPIHKKEHHDHLICIECGKIIEFTCGEIEKMQETIAQRYKFHIKNHKLEIYGLCLNCAKRRRE